MQFMVEGADKSLSIIYKKSIVVEKEDAPLAIGDVVKFMWPENGKTQKEFSGTIIAKNEDEKVLLALKEAKMKTWKKKIGVKHYNMVKTSADDENEVSNAKGKTRKQPPTLLEKEILKVVNKSDTSSLQRCVSSEVITPEWVFDAFDNLKHDVTQEFDSAKEKVLKKIDFLKSSFPSDSALPTEKIINETKISEESRRRSWGMPLNFDDVKNNKEADTIYPSHYKEADNAKNFVLDRSTDSLEVIDLASCDSDYSVDNEKNTIIQVKTEEAEKSESDVDNWQSVEMNRIKSEKESSDENSWDVEKPSTSSFLPKKYKAKPSSKPPKLSSVINRNKLISELTFSSDEENNFQPPKKIRKPQEKKSEKDQRYLKVKNNNQVSNNKDDEEFDELGDERKNDESGDGDESNSEWTLKYQEESENVTELVKGSKIFANKLDLKTALDKCHSQNDLARALLIAVFKKEALMKCSLTGQKPRFPGKSKDAKPGLNVKGVDIILLYVQTVAQKLSWPSKDRSSIRRSMSQKLSELNV